MNAIPLSFSLLIVPAAFAQQSWCEPVVDASNSGGSGILAVDLDGSPHLHRNSPIGEGFVFTGMTTTLHRGMHCSLSVDKQSGNICLNNNIRVYIDFDQDLSFDDAGELVAAMGYAGEGPDVFSIYVPLYAVEGPTRMRVVEKMTPDCGYGPIDPCGLDPVAGVHRGEIEDYAIVIGGQVGMSDLDGPSATQLTVSNGSVQLHWDDAARPASADVSIHDAAGRAVFTRSGPVPPDGILSLSVIGTPGVYIACVDLAVRREVIRFMVE